MEVTAIKFEQNEKTMFFFVLEAKKIYERFDVSRRIDDKEKGYQRSFNKTRINQIKKYIDKEKGILPNSILVNIDAEKYSFSDKSNKLTFVNNGTLGFIIDGQHRVWGANNSEANILLPVVATIELTTQQQAQLFVKINKSQKGVPVSLYLDLLDITDGVIEDFDGEDVSAQRRAIEIAKRLNEDEESPLFGLIRTTGDSGIGIALAEFVNQIKEYVDPKKGKLLNYGFEDQCKIFKIYFKAVKSVFLEEWNNKDSLILKTVGFGGLMKSFYEIFQLVIQGDKPYSTDTTIQVLEKISGFKFDSQNLPGGGIKGQENAGKTIVSSIKRALKGDSEFNAEIIE